MDGQVTNEDAKQLRNLSSTRNALVHGDLNVSVADGDVSDLVEKIEEIASRTIAA